MDLWESKRNIRINKVQQEILDLIDKKNKLEKELKAIEEYEEKLKNLEEIKNIYRDLKIKYYSLSLTSGINHDSDFDNALLNEIAYYFQYLEILTKKYKAEEINFEYFLELAQLQYDYFDRNREKIIYEKQEQIKDLKPVIFSGETMIPEINKIIGNIRKAQSNVEKIIKEKRKDQDFEFLYIYFEVLGDLYVNIYALIKEDKTLGTMSRMNYIDYAYQCYEESYKNKIKTELPAIYQDGLHGLSYIKPFYDFFNEIKLNIFDVKVKLNFIYGKFSNYLEKKTKSYCWKTGEYCEYRKDTVFDINEGNGVFISMNYNVEKNFELLKYIEKILTFFKLRPILKQTRLRSPSWTREICCTIYNNKYTIVFLDKYSPNVVLELGVAFGMGRKSIILINENQKREKDEEQLFSMIRDYDCIIYKNVEDLFKNLIRSINGIFFNRIDYDIPNILTIFSPEDINYLNKLILK